jgi:hypothetical protein
MLRDLGIEIDFVKNPVTIGICDQFAVLTAESGRTDYAALLRHAFPDSAGGISAVSEEIKKAVSYMNVLYGIDNPLFGDALKDTKYLIKTLLPWLLRYHRAMSRVGNWARPSMSIWAADIQHGAHRHNRTATFLRNAASFALSYFNQYLDYSYPVTVRAYSPNVWWRSSANGVVRSGRDAHHRSGYAGHEAKTLPAGR